jgi:hypothetical protein
MTKLLTEYGEPNIYEKIISSMWRMLFSRLRRSRRVYHFAIDQLLDLSLRTAQFPQNPNAVLADDWSWLQLPGIRVAEANGVPNFEDFTCIVVLLGNDYTA